MPIRPFKQIDVFTATPYFGNPLAVVLDGAGLDDEALQRFAHCSLIRQGLHRIGTGNPHRLDLARTQFSLGVQGLFQRHRRVEPGGSDASGAQGIDHHPQGSVLRRGESLGIGTFELDPDRIVVAIFTRAPLRAASMPGPLIAADKLDHPAIASNIKMG